MKNSINLVDWEKLSKDEKFNFIENILKTKNLNFTIKGLETFEQNQVKLETFVLSYGEDEFVFIPGCDNVTLGWDIDKCNLGENVIKVFEECCKENLEYEKEVYEENKEYYEEEIEKAKKNNDEKKVNELIEDMKDELEYFEEKKIEADEYLNILYKNIKENVSPLRTVNIGSMIVERDLSNKYFNKNQEIKFSLPTEDEYEYLCNGGTRTFFRWGDSLEDELICMSYRGMASNNYPDEYKEVLYIPNMFGLYIAYNSYIYEVLESPNNIVKGGDGGCSLCGGDGPIYFAPCYSAFYRESIVINDVVKNFCGYRRIIRLD